VLVEKNWLHGGQARLNLSTNGTDLAAGVTVKDNRFIRSGYGFYIFAQTGHAATLTTTSTTTTGPLSRSCSGEGRLMVSLHNTFEGYTGRRDDHHRHQRRVDGDAFDVIQTGAGTVVASTPARSRAASRPSWRAAPRRLT
jgi:hypothetical protein